MDCPYFVSHFFKSAIFDTYAVNALKPYNKYTRLQINNHICHHVYLV